MLSTLLTLALMFVSAPSAPDDRPDQTVRVETAQGLVEGLVRDGVSTHYNIPYAAPPLGPLRWRPPQPAVAWDGVRDAGTRGPICIQPPANGDNGVGPLPMSEDCLQLNVFAPAERSGPLPVMVWIHGGGYVNGSATADLYDGASLARRGTVVVTVNYRLGRLGFFDHPALAAERPEGEAAANYGLMDMIAALEWVRNNIGAFGGDPGDVMVFGESAGGLGVTQLMVAPSARGLFHKAAVQSGGGRFPFVHPDREGPDGAASLMSRAQAWTAAAGVDAASAEALRAIPAERFLSPAPSFREGDLNIVDGQVMPEPVAQAFAAGRQAPVPMIVGANSAEFFWTDSEADTPEGRLDDVFDAATREGLIRAYGGLDSYRRNIVSDIMFVEPARLLARLHARAGHPTWHYRFDVVSAAAPQEAGGAGHAWDRQYVFDTLDASPWPTDAMDQRAADVVSGYWSRFARTGDPNGDGAPIWPQAGDALDTLEFGADRTTVIRDPRASILERISRHYGDF